MWERDIERRNVGERDREKECGREIERRNVGER